MVSKRCASAKKYDFLPFLVSKWCSSANINDLLALFWSRSDAPNAKIYDLLPLLWSRIGASMSRSTIFCRCFGLEMVPQCEDERFVAVASSSKWGPSAKKYVLLPLLSSRSGAPVPRGTICCRCFCLECCLNVKTYDLSPLVWSRVVPQNEEVPIATVGCVWKC